MPRSVAVSSAPPYEAQRLLVLTAMDPWSASTRYRALQHLPRLKPHFRDITVSHPRDTIARRPGRVGQARYFLTHGAQYARRRVEVGQLVGRSDAVFVQRGLYAFGPAGVVKSLERFPGRIVFDLDDAVFRTSPSLQAKGPAAQWLYGPHQALRLMRRADAIIVSTPALAEMLPAGLVEPAVLPTVPDPSEYEPTVRDPAAAVVVGWAGTVGGLVYLDPLKGVFESLAKADIATFEVVSSTPWSGPASFHRWRMDESTTVFGRFSIGIMPLPDAEYTRAKAGFKLLQYMASGVPVVGSPVGVNEELITRAEAGFVARSPAEWEDALRTLATDAELRARMGANGRRFVEAYADLDAQALTIRRMLSGGSAA